MVNDKQQVSISSPEQFIRACGLLNLGLYGGGMGCVVLRQSPRPACLPACLLLLNKALKVHCAAVCGAISIEQHWIAERHPISLDARPPNVADPPGPP